MKMLKHKIIKYIALATVLLGAPIVFAATSQPYVSGSLNAATYNVGATSASTGGRVCIETGTGAAWSTFQSADSSYKLDDGTTIAAGAKTLPDQQCTATPQTGTPSGATATKTGYCTDNNSDSATLKCIKASDGLCHIAQKDSSGTWTNSSNGPSAAAGVDDAFINNNLCTKSSTGTSGASGTGATTTNKVTLGNGTQITVTQQMCFSVTTGEPVGMYKASDGYTYDKAGKQYTDQALMQAGYTTTTDLDKCGFSGTSPTPNGVTGTQKCFKLSSGSYVKASLQSDEASWTFNGDQSKTSATEINEIGQLSHGNGDIAQFTGQGSDLSNCNNIPSTTITDPNYSTGGGATSSSGKPAAPPANVKVPTTASPNFPYGNGSITFQVVRFSYAGSPSSAFGKEWAPVGGVEFKISVYPAKATTGFNSLKNIFVGTALAQTNVDFASQRCINQVGVWVLYELKNGKWTHDSAPSAPDITDAQAATASDTSLEKCGVSGTSTASQQNKTNNNQPTAANDQNGIKNDKGNTGTGAAGATPGTVSIPYKNVSPIDTDLIQRISGGFYNWIHGISYEIDGTIPDNGLSSSITVNKLPAGMYQIMISKQNYQTSKWQVEMQTQANVDLGGITMTPLPNSEPPSIATTPPPATGVTKYYDGLGVVHATKTDGKKFFYEQLYPWCGWQLGDGPTPPNSYCAYQPDYPIPGIPQFKMPDGSRATDAPFQRAGKSPLDWAADCQSLSIGTSLDSSILGKLKYVAAAAGLYNMYKNGTTLKNAGIAYLGYKAFEAIGDNASKSGTPMNINIALSKGNCLGQIANGGLGSPFGGILGTIGGWAQNAYQYFNP